MSQKQPEEFLNAGTQRLHSHLNSAEQNHRERQNQGTDLEGELGAAKVGLLLLPEVVGLDDERHADLDREELLQRLEQRLDELPLGAAHVDDDGEATLADVLAAEAERGEGPVRANQPQRRKATPTRLQTIEQL